MGLSLLSGTGLCVVPAYPRDLHPYIMQDLGETSSSFPWWIWIAIGVLVVGGIVIFALKYQKPDDEQYRPYRGDDRSRRRSRRSSRGSRSGRHRSGSDLDRD